MQELPKFSEVKPELIKSELEKHLNANRNLINELLSQSNYTWDNLIQPLEDADVSLNNFWSVISHMNSVVNTDELRETYDSCLPLLTEYATEIGMNKKFYEAFQFIRHSEHFDQLAQAQKQVILHGLRDFKLAGVGLEGEDKKRYQVIQLKMSELCNKYEQNLMDATDAWSDLITDEAMLKGIPNLAKQSFKQAAEEKNQNGWLIKIDFPSYHAVITYADNRALRKKLYTAYCTRASDVGPHDAKYDNSEIMFEILNLRNEEAKLLGFDHYGEYSLATKMAKNSDMVFDFLNKLTEKAKPVALEEWADLKAFAKKHLALDELHAWDIAYASEKLRLYEHDLSQEALRPYFEVNHVIEGLFTTAKKLFGVTITKDQERIDVWHEDVSYYEIFDADQNFIASFYLDLYARAKKRGGAWMDECRSRHKHANLILQTPIAFLTCNFTPPLKDKPALLTHDEVLTLFHEFGHGLQHMLTKIDIASVAGINGVAWDAVEFASQFMENWCWQKESLDLIAYHYETKTLMPDELFERLFASKNFQSGLHMLRQIELSLFDFRLHTEFDGTNTIQETLNDVRRKIAVVPAPEFNRFQHGFSHIFAGGYAAGYYSYKWAEVLASDAFGRFKKAGIFDAILGEQFRKCILETGGAEDPLDLFIRFQGREPNVDALLKESGIL